MASSTKQAKRLKKDAVRLWSDQQQLLERANTLARDAWPHAQHYAKSAVGPGAVAFYEGRVRPNVGRSAQVGRAAGAAVGSTAKDAVRGTVLPAVTSAAAAALALANEAGERIGVAGASLGKQTSKAKEQLDQRTKSGQRSEAKARVKLKTAAKAGKAAGKAGKAAAKVGTKRAAAAAGRKQSGPGAGGIVGVVLGVAAIGGIAYAVWQTLRADDDLWVADEDTEITPTTDAPTV